MDYFDRARRFAVVLLVLAGAALITGTFLPWTTEGTLPPQAELPPGDRLSDPLAGFSAGEGKVVVGAAVVILVAAGLLALARDRRYGYLALAASIVAGGVSFSFYGAVDDATSDMHRRFEIVGEIDPGAGLTLVVIGALVGIVAAVLGVVASPADRRIS